MSKVLLGMSGGVDSSVAAALLMRAGYEVIGATLVMHDIHEKDAAAAKTVADALGITHYTVDMRGDFEKYVLSPFVSEYENGRTPNPCVICNGYIKFPGLIRAADSLGCEYIATGHYAAIGNRDGHPVITAATDKAKDQSYFLYMLGKNILSRLLFPLSGMTKPEIRALAEELKLPSASSPDSQDICFIKDISCADFVAGRSKKPPVLGNFVDTDGKVLGKHKGISAYTVGQRKGLGVSSTSPLYVSHIDAESGNVILCRENELYRTKVYAENCSYFAGKLPKEPFEATVSLRYTKKPGRATVTALPDNRVLIEFTEPQRAPAPGQSAVFFDGDDLLGGGIIESSEI
ncbi:MAG: tRNA 2-thiouridine(34) synthase MnmA [Clostridia bacterium]|nr:tRNA 2-thiouridine(34) synthase MnmA [Clostridia bacterium]